MTVAEAIARRSTAPRPLRVLAVARREPWPLNSGGRLRLYHFLRGLTERAEVTLLLPEPAQDAAFFPEKLAVVSARPKRARPASRRAAASAAPAESGASIEQDARAERHRSSVSWATRWARGHFGWFPRVSAWLRRHAGPDRFDVALLYGAVTGQYVDDLCVPALWDPVDELVLYATRATGGQTRASWLSTAWHLPFYAAFEGHVARRARATIFSSSIDASYARRWSGSARIETVTNGVDLDYFHAMDEPAVPGTVAFVGSLSFPPNVEAVLWFAQRIWPRLQRADARRRLLIVGREPHAAVRAIARLPGVELHADVPDVRPYLSQAAVVVVPTRQGGGVKNKVLEACAAGRPVVASPRALGGLTARRGRDVICAGTEGAWRRALACLLDQPALAHAIGASGRAWVSRTHRWSRLAARLHGLLVECGGAGNASRISAPTASALSVTRPTRKWPAQSRARRVQPREAACL